MHSQSTVRRLQELQAEALQMGVRRLAFRSAVRSLTTTSQVPRRSQQREPIDLTEALPGIAVAEISTPPFHPAVKIVDHLTDGDETPLGSGQLSESLAGTSFDNEVARATAELTSW